MKRLMFILIVWLIYLQGYSQPKRIRNLDRQNTYSDSSFVVLDDDSFSKAKKMTLDVLAPRISSGSYTVTSSSLDKDANKMRYDVSGTEKTTTLRYINPDITDLSAVTSITTSNLLTVYTTGDKKITYDNFMIDLVAESEFEDAVVDLIDNEVDSSFVIILLLNTVTDQALMNGGLTHGYLSMQKIGNIVVGQIKAVRTDGGSLLADYTIPSEFRPSTVHSGNAIGFYYSNVEGANDNYVKIQEDGSIYMEFTDNTANTNGISFSWITD